MASPARTALRAAAMLAGAMLLGLPARAAAQGLVPVSVVNRATATYDAGGVPAETSAEATVTVSMTAGLELVSPQQAAVHPGERRVFAHRLTNVGSGLDRFVLTVSGPAGWAVRLFRDVNGDGVLAAVDSAVAGPLPLERGQSAALLLVLDVPEDAADVAQVELGIRGVSQADPTVSASVQDIVSVRRPLPAMVLGKLVDRSQATPGDTLRYTVSFANQGDAVSTGAVLLDTLPAGLRVVRGSLALAGAPLTDEVDADSGSVAQAGGRDLVRVALGTVLPGGAGVVTFRAVVAADATGDLVNVAQLTQSGGAGTVSSPGVGTSLRFPELSLAKELTSADSVRLGDAVEFRLTWANRSAEVVVRDAVLEDTLPEGLELVRADGAFQQDGRVLRWRLGNLAPGQSGSIALVTRAVSVPAGGSLVNRAVMRGANASAVDASSVGVTVSGLQGDELEIEKRAGVLEAGLGDAVPYTIQVTNRAMVPVRGVVVMDRLPEGVRYLADRLLGADSARVDGRDLRIFVGTIAPGERRTVRYAGSIIGGGGDAALGNQAYALGENGAVHSDTVTAWVRLRGAAMQVRTIVGKVWMDLDDDGRQDPGERGVAGMEIWSEDGEVVTTDRQGRYSFRNATVGSHALRLDQTGIPAGLRLPRAADGIVRVRLEGWTMPRADFRLVPADSAVAVVIPAAPTGSAPAPVDSLAPLRSGPAMDAPLRSAPAVAAAADTTRRLTVAPARTAQDRADEDRRTFVEGPVVRIIAPVDGAVVTGNRLYVGVRGEPGAKVVLFRDSVPVGEAVLRPDGVADFVGVELPAEGPARLSVAMQNSWSRARADTVVVHRAGHPERIELPVESMDLRAEARAADTVRVRVLDRWNVPVPGALVSPLAAGATAEGQDADRSSLGLQLAADGEGRVAVALRPGKDVRAGELRLAAGSARARLALRVLASTRPLIATGAGQVGVGAAPESFGAVTVRGSVGRETSVSVSADSRRADPADDFFGRGHDPLEESRYPVFGDASERRVLSGNTQVLSARVERGLDWVQLGDVETGAFGGDPRLGVYSRALSGVMGRVGRGNVEVRAFGSLTDQVLAQRQLRAEGSSGPYRFGGPVRPGTDRVAIEVRARDNAARVISREELSRWSDYQIDYTTGTVLLQRPVPATDVSGNPVYVVAMLEQRSGGEAQLVGGLRVAVDAARAMHLRGLDTLSVSALTVRDGGDVSRAGSGHDLVGTGVRMRAGSLALGAEVLRSQRGDSTAIAGRAEGSWTIGRARLGGEYLGVGEGFGSGTDPRLSAGVQELRLSAEYQTGASGRVRLTHERQSFGSYGVERATTGLRSEQTLGGRAMTAELGVSSDQQGSGSSSVAQGRFGVDMSNRLKFWMEGVHALADRTARNAVAMRPDQLALGASYRVLANTRVEASHRWVRTHGDSARTFGVSSLNLRTGTPFGGEVWGGVERADDERAGQSAVLGMNQRLTLGGGWSASAMYERRFGLSNAALLDPARALPFAQAERDRWSAGAGIEWAPGDTVSRLRVSGELHGGGEARGSRLDVAAETQLSAGVALLTRHDWWQDTRLTGQGEVFARRDRSMLGLALRPVESNALNLLGKLEYRRDENPLASGLLSGAASGERRLIASTDAVWSVRPGQELAVRYALRWAERTDSAGVGDLPLASTSHFFGVRAEQGLRWGLKARIDGRLMVNGQGAASPWNLAPALVAGIGERVEVEAGYRFGNLNDPDFARQGGTGFYAVIGMRFTESLFNRAGDFWRNRLGND